MLEKMMDNQGTIKNRLSHEMKTPIGVIRAYAEGIQDETDELKRQRYSEIIISETERMGMLIENLLDLSALENGAVSLMPERFDFVEFVETIAGRLLIDMPEKLPKIWEKFYRDKNAKYNGSGLGLAIVAQILSMQDLEYGAENLSDGVQFFFSIPIIK